MSPRPSMLWGVELQPRKPTRLISLREADDPAKPYGDVTYADPGYQDDGKKRYPLDTEQHVRAAWSYINQSANQEPYTAQQVSQIKSRIMAAGKKFGITFSKEADYKPMTGTQMREATAAVAAEDSLDYIGRLAMLGAVIETEVELAEAGSGDGHTHSGPPRSISDHLTSASHGMSASHLPGGPPAMHNLHENLHGGDIAKPPVGYKPKESAVDVIGDVFQIRERAIGNDGITTIKLIGPGWGSSGYYGKDVLERDIPKAFSPGTKMFWDHPTKTEEAERPEGSLKNLAAELISTPRWQEGPDGPGMYGEAKAFGPFQNVIEELAPHIGVSIRALGRAREGEAEGRKGKLVDAIEVGQSVDFVTAPGAGGRIVSLFEAARGGKMTEQNTKTEQELAAEKAAADKAAADAKAEEDRQAAEAAAATTTTTESARERRLEERLAMRDARDIVGQLIEAKGNVPQATAKRLLETVPLRFTLTDDGELDAKAFTETANKVITDELAYITEIRGNGAVHGMAPITETASAEEAKADAEGLRENLTKLGSTKAQAELAVPIR